MKCTTFFLTTFFFCVATLLRQPLLPPLAVFSSLSSFLFFSLPFSAPQLQPTYILREVCAFGSSNAFLTAGATEMHRLGYSSSHIGLASVPGAIGQSLASQWAGKLAGEAGKRQKVLIGVESSLFWRCFCVFFKGFAKSNDGMVACLIWLYTTFLILFDANMILRTSFTIGFPQFFMNVLLTWMFPWKELLWFILSCSSPLLSFACCCLPWSSSF